jgi:hypothetical protein
VQDTAGSTQHSTAQHTEDTYLSEGPAEQLAHKPADVPLND